MPKAASCAVYWPKAGRDPSEEQGLASRWEGWFTTGGGSLDIAVLREFYELSRSLNYATVSRRLFISPSTLTKHIQSLEKEIDVRLLVRDSHSVRLTAAGKLFSERIGKVLAEYDDALRAVSEFESGISSAMSVGFIPEVTLDYVTEACEFFRARHPQVKLSAFALEVERVLQAIREGSLDLGITLCLMDALPEGMEMRILEQERFGILVCEGSDLALKADVSAADLDGRKALVPSPASFPTIARITSARLKKAAPNIQIVEEMNGIGSMAPLLKANNLIALTYECVARYYPDDFRFVPVRDIDIKAIIGAFWKTSRENANIEPFVACVESAIERRKAAVS